MNRVLTPEYPLCFACGRKNPIGLALRFTCEGGVARASFLPRDEHQGYPGMLHGGLVCTLLDEAMAYAVHALGCEGYTARLEVRFRAPVPLHRSLSVEARAGRRKGRMVEVTARLLGAEGEELATATGRYITRARDRSGAPSEREG